MLTLDRSLCLIEFFCRQFFQYIKNHLASFACRSIDHRDRCIEFPRPLFRWNFRKKSPTGRRLTSNTVLTFFFFNFCFSYFFFSFFLLYSLRAETYVFAVRRVAWTLRFTRGHSRRYTVSTTFLCNRHFRSFRMPIAARLMATLVRVQNRFITSDLSLRTISIDYAIHSLQHLYRFTLSLLSFSYIAQFYELIDTRKQ